jgi:quinol monooxygenase YgiN
MLGIVPEPRRSVAVFALVVRFDVRPGAVEDFDRLVAETAPAIREQEPGTLIYAVHGVEGEPNVRMFYELYRDRASFDEHERQPHTVRFLQEREQYLSGVRVEFLTPPSGKGLPDVGE